MNSNQMTHRLVIFSFLFSFLKTKQHGFRFELGILAKVQFSPSAFDFV